MDNDIMTFQEDTISGMTINMICDFIYSNYSRDNMFKGQSDFSSYQVVERKWNKYFLMGMEDMLFSPEEVSGIFKRFKMFMLKKLISKNISKDKLESKKFFTKEYINLYDGIAKAGDYADKTVEDVVMYYWEKDILLFLENKFYELHPELA